MHALSLCFILATCFSIFLFISVPTNTENSKFIPIHVILFLSNVKLHAGYIKEMSL